MKKAVLVEVSARHVHVTKEALEVLFGKGYELTNKKDLSQPGQFVCNERVVIEGPKGSVKASILGPCRNANQVEIAFTDARNLGVVPPVRESGDVKGSAPCKMVGPCGEIELTEGVIVAKRHIHMTPEDAENYGLKDKQVVSVKVPTEGRAVTFDDVVVRVSDKFKLAMHVDTDEANAAAIPGSCEGEILA